MSAVDFEYLLNKIGPYITKTDTIMRKAIPANERLAVTLRFFASGDSFVSLSYLFKMSNQVISDIVHEVCEAMITSLKDEIKVTIIIVGGIFNVQVQSSHFTTVNNLTIILHAKFFKNGVSRRNCDLWTRTLRVPPTIIIILL